MINPANTDLMLNGIDQIKNLCLDLMDDLEYYRKRPSPNKAYIDIHEKRINLLFSVCQTFTDVNTNIENDSISVNIAQHALNDKIFKLEACLVYFGVSLSEIAQFTGRDSALIIQDIKTCQAEKWRQIPFMYKHLLNDYEPPVIQLSKKIIQLANSQKTEPGTNGKKT